jgi:hemolysin activation/secretion protein
MKETIDRSFKLPKNWGLRGVINAQYAPDILLYSERMALTGAYAVRGYYEDSLYADSGLMLNLELQAPPKTFKIGDKQAQLQAFGFYDIGRGFNNTADVNNDLSSKQKNNTVSSFGVGARFSLSPLVQLNGTLGVAQQGLNNRGDDVMGNISLVIGY